MPNRDLPLLVGETNPYGSDSHFALYPYPENSAGGRLCRRILRLRPHTYLSRFHRQNLCSGRWKAAEARGAAGQIVAQGLDWTIVLLGAKVSQAFGVEFEPFTVLNPGGTSRFVVLPHPSGRSRLWNDPGAYDRARAALTEGGIAPGEE